MSNKISKQVENTQRMFDQVSDWYTTAQEGLSEASSTAWDNIQEGQRLREAGEISMFENIIRQGGDAASVPSWMLNEALTAVPGYEYIQEKMGQGVSYLEENSNIGRAISSALTENPRLAETVNGMFQMGEFLPGVRGVNRNRQANADLDRLTGVDSGKGERVASLNNYIDDFYGRKEVGGTTPIGNMEGASAPPTRFEGIIEQQLYDANSTLNKELNGPIGKIPAVKKVANKAGVGALKRVAFESTAKTRAAVRKMTSMAKFGGVAVKDTIKDLFSPSSHALFREQGLSNTGKEIIASHLADKALKGSPESIKILEDITKLKDEYKALPKPGGKLTPEHIKINAKIQKAASGLSSRELPKAVAEAIYQLHIGQQGGRRGGLNAGLEGIAKESFVESYNKYDKGTLSSWFTQHNRGESDFFDVDITDADASMLEQTIINANKQSFGDSGVPAITVMKEGANLPSGNHQYDLFNTKKAGPAQKINSAFDALGNKPTTVPDLAKALEETGLNITHVGKDGKVFFNGSSAGSAIVEGGINVSGFVKPDGTATFVMADVHDFFENVPGVNKLTPNTLLAVSPPMTTNFLVGSKTKPKHYPVDQKVTNTKRSVPKGKSELGLQGSLEAIANAKPSAEVLDAARRRQSGMLTAASQPLATAAHNLPPQKPKEEEPMFFELY
jgi:hypothetical protein